MTRVKLSSVFQILTVGVANRTHLYPCKNMAGTEEEQAHKPGEQLGSEALGMRSRAY